MPKFHVVGTGPGDARWVLPAAVEVIRNSEILFGSEKLIGYWASEAGGGAKKLVPLSGSVDAFMQRLAEAHPTARCAVLVSGDAGFYSLLGAVKRSFRCEDYMVVPGITAFQLACAKIGLPWQDFLLASAHGRPLDELTGQLNSSRGAVVLTDRRNTPAAVCRLLADSGWSDRDGWICEKIAQPGENIIRIRLRECPEQKEYKLCLLILQPGSTE